MSPVWEDDALEGQDSSDRPLAPEEAGEVQGEPQEPFSIHVSHSGNERSILISEITARTLLGVLDTVTVKGSAGKFQLAIAQSELEKGLAELSQPAPSNSSPSRAERRRSLRSPR